jgi:hypothetical protein
VHSWKKKLLIVGYLTLAHLIVTVGLLLFSFGASMDRFDSGRMPTFHERLAESGFTVFQLPLMPLLRFSPIRFPGLWGYIPFLVNSLVWALVLSLIISAFQKRKHA